MNSQERDQPSSSKPIDSGKPLNPHCVPGHRAKSLRVVLRRLVHVHVYIYYRALKSPCDISWFYVGLQL